MININAIINFWRKIVVFSALVFGFILILTGLTKLTSLLRPATIEELGLEFGLAFGLNILPFIVIIVAALWLVSRFTQAVYGLSSTGDGFFFLIRRQFGRRGFTPFTKIDQGQIPSDETNIVLNVGGPGSLIVSNDSAVVLERKGRLTKVHGPGFFSLDPFEKIYDAVDLRPKRFSLNVGAMSREGIPVNWEVEIQYQIANGEQEPCPDNGSESSTDKGEESCQNPLYQFSENSIFRAATSKWRRERQGGKLKDIMDWEKLVVISRTEGTLRSIIIQHPLDQLIGLTKADTQVVREAIQEELVGVLPGKVAGLGAKILGVKLGNLQVEDQVTQQWIKTWQARWQRLVTEKFVPEDIDRIPTYELNKLRMGPLKALYENGQENGNFSSQAITSMIFMYFFDMLAWIRSQTAAQSGQNGNTSGWSNGPSDPALPPGGPESTYPQQQHTPHTWESSPMQPKPKPTYPTQPKPILKLLPIVDEISAGKEKSAFDDIIGQIRQTDEFEFELELEGQPPESLGIELLRGKSRISFPKEYRYIVVPVSGDSMNQAGILPGDYVILQQSGEVPLRPTSGDIVAIVFRDEDNKTTLKRISIQPDGVTLKPESSNPEHKPRTLTQQNFMGDNPPVDMVGIAIAMLKPLPSYEIK